MKNKEVSDVKLEQSLYVSSDTSFPFTNATANIIMWREPNTINSIVTNNAGNHYTDFALSFQESDGCESLW
jgi:hypothetical protein